MVWAWTMPCATPGARSRGLRDESLAGLDALDPMPVAARNPGAVFLVCRSRSTPGLTTDGRSCQNGSTPKGGRSCVVCSCREADPPTDLPRRKVRRLPARHPGVARRTERRIGRERLHRTSCLRPLVDPVPVPGWLHGHRRAPDRGDGQLHRGWDAAWPQSARQGRVRGPVSGRDLQLGFRTGGADAVRPGPQERECQRHVRQRAGQPRRVAHGFGRRALDRDRADHDRGQRAWLEA
jgi:hypothetical protein